MKKFDRFLKSKRQQPSSKPVQQSTDLLTIQNSNNSISNTNTDCRSQLPNDNHNQISTLLINQSQTLIQQLSQKTSSKEINDSQKTNTTNINCKQQKKLSQNSTYNSTITTDNNNYENKYNKNKNNKFNSGQQQSKQQITTNDNRFKFQVGDSCQNDQKQDNQQKNKISQEKMIMGKHQKNMNGNKQRLLSFQTSNDKISKTSEIEKLQTKLVTPKINAQFLQNQSSQVSFIMPYHNQTNSINNNKKPRNPNVRSSSFASFQFSQNQKKYIQAIKLKDLQFQKTFSSLKNLNNSSIIKKTITTSQDKHRYKSKHFTSGSKITQNSAEHSFIKKYVYGSGKLPQKILISSWNVNGIKKSFSKRFIFGYLKLSNPDIFCVQEIRIDYQTFKKEPVVLEGYNAYWNFCKCSKGYSGVAVFSKYPPIRIIQDFPQYQQFSQQGRVLTLQFQKFYLINVYCPAAGQRMQRLNYKVFQYQPVFFKYVNQLVQTKQVIIAGDLNVARNQLDAYIYNDVQSRQAYHPLQRKSFEKFLQQSQWIDTFRYFHPGERKFSWWNIQLTGRNKNMGKRIDYYLVKESFMKWIEDSDVCNHIWGSDHCPIQLKVNFGNSGEVSKNKSTVNDKQKEQKSEKNVEQGKHQNFNNVQALKTSQQ